MQYGRMWPKYAEQWDSMIINASRVREFDNLAKYAMEHSRSYRVIEEQTGVPWPMIACLHQRESGANFNTYLGNGDRLDRKTVNVPAGRGPFASFEEGAIDALHYDRLDRVIDWRLEKILYNMELFNGAGYYNHGLPSPYVWGGTNIQKPGKYVADGQWSSTAIDRQPGCAPLLKSIMKLDPSIEYKRED